MIVMDLDAAPEPKRGIIDHEKLENNRRQQLILEAIANMPSPEPQPKKSTPAPSAQPKPASIPKPKTTLEAKLSSPSGPPRPPSPPHETHSSLKQAYTQQLLASKKGLVN
jgi:hypothetical protein